MHRSLAFPLLKALSEEGDKFAKQRFAEEIARRYLYGNETVRRFLFEEEYLLCLTNEDILSGILTPEEAICMEKIMGFGERYKIVPYFAKMRGMRRGDKSYLSLKGARIRELEIVINEDLNRIPREIENLDNLYRLNISIRDGYDDNLLGEVFCLPSLEYLTIFCDSTPIIPDSFHYFPNLKYLYVRGFEYFNRPTLSFENSFAKLTKLEELHLHFVELEKIPDTVIHLKKLKDLSLSKTTLKTIPVSLICTLRSLRALELNYNDDLEIQTTEIEKLKKKVKEFKYSTEF